MKIKYNKQTDFKTLFIAVIIISLIIAVFIGMMDFPSADYSGINPLLVLIHDILTLAFAACFGFAFSLLGAWLVVKDYVEDT